jgi:hypothetical protein
MDESARDVHRNVRLTERGARARALALAFGLAVMLASLAASAVQARGTAVTNAVAGCQAITITFSGFPNLPNNTVTEQVRIDGVRRAVVHTSVFNGPTGSDTIPLPLTPGTHGLDVKANWNTNGAKGGRDMLLPRIKCSGFSIHTPADRANVISGEETLVWVYLPGSVPPGSVKVSLNGSDVTSKFALRPNGLYEGLVTGLQPGSNVVTAEAPGESTAQYTIIDHVIGGPVVAGPQVHPWVCRNTGATDAQCDAPTTYQYQYKSSATGKLEPYNPGSPPSASEVASTTTDNGQTVPFIIRIETGYQDRDQYQIAVLYQPGKAWETWAPQPQFNHKLLITHGASCGIDHQSSTAPSVTSDTVGVPGVSVATGSPTTALGLGFAVMSTALDNAGHNCSLATQAESLIMAKEHLVDHYGTLRYTIGTGCSGGSLVQQQVANAYPGIYQGILPQCSFQDSWSNGQEISDYHLTRKYFEHPETWGTGVAWTPVQIAAIEGHPNYGNAIIFDTVYWETLANPSKTCNGVSSAEAYNPETHPSGVRCTLADYMINVFGPRPEGLWGSVEKKLGHGFAGLPIDNVGVQYGLQGLEEGVITPAQFVDINSKIGGADVDLKPTAERFNANEPALKHSYLSGAVNEANNLKSVAIIDLRGPDPGAFHDAYRTWSMRARLEHTEGHFPLNHVIWFGEVPLIGSPTYTTEGLLAEDKWLSAVEGDKRTLTLEEKVAQDRPAAVHDKCSNIEGIEEVSVPGIGPVCENPTAQTRFSTPRVIAGEDIATDKQKCQLKPLVRSDYYPIQFTEEQWTALQKAWPTGVCDFSKAGVSQTGTVPWQTYQDDSNGGAVIYGGKPLGAAPANSGEGWTSSAFAGWLK